MVKEENSNIKFLTRVIITGVAVYGEILQYAEQNSINLIVIGTKGKSGFKKLLLGSIASDIVTYSNCPILVTK
ncbi:MAG: universal stress protein [Nitrososphaeraceae archaeon]|nr:universal stress protein [Nitrososphaeraceae archaeon]